MNAEAQRHRGRNCGGRQNRRTGWKRKFISGIRSANKRTVQVRGAWGSFQIEAEVVATRGPSVRRRGIIPLGDCLMAKPSPSIRLPDYSINLRGSDIILRLYYHAWNIPITYAAKNGLRRPWWG
jgi:hypothetical protein